MNSKPGTSTSPATPASQAARLIRPLRADLKRLLRALVRVDSVNTPPDGKETAAQFVLNDFFRAQGLRSEMYDVSFIQKTGSPLVCRKRHYSGRKNLCVSLPGRGPGKSLLLNGHMDTVPPGNVGWSASPWSGHFKNGRVIGLGSFDMKGGVVANAAVLCALKRAGIRLDGDLFFESVVDEEWGGGGGTLAARLRGTSADACVIPEGTQLQIYRASRGGFVVDLVARGGDPHAYFSSTEVLSPAIPLGRLLGWIESWAKKRSQLKPQGAYADMSDPAPVQVLAIEANRLDADTPLSVPVKATVRVYFQFVPEEDMAAVVRQIEESLRAFEAGDPFFSRHPVEWLPLLEVPLQSHELENTHPWVDCMSTSAAAVLGRTAVVTAAPYPCDAGLLQREFGIPTLVFGPCGGGAHNPNEYVEFDSVLETAAVILDAALHWAGG